jgi:hypothetical protein
MRRKVIDAMKKRYKAIESGGIISTAISTITNEKPHIITKKINCK